jgi:hypothetical protein
MSVLLIGSMMLRTGYVCVLLTYRIGHTTDQKTELASSVSRTGLDDRGSRTTLPIIASSKAPTVMNTVVIIGPSPSGSGSRISRRAARRGCTSTSSRRVGWMLEPAGLWDKALSELREIP